MAYALSGVAVARECTDCRRASNSKTVQTKAAVCKRAQSTAELNVNNVRALINGYGNMWYDGSVAKYHVPKSGNSCPLYCAALWIGGTDVNDQLRLSALTFGSYGDDYWPGPLTIDNTASTDISICNEYDKHFIITQAEVQAFKAMFDYSGTEPVAVNFVDADVPEIIKNWPAEDKTGQCNYLAPFYDADHDGHYDYTKGDYPYYDFDNELCPRDLKRKWGSAYTQHVQATMEDDHGDVKGGILADQVLKGDQTIWWVFNDMGNVHTESKGQAIGMEIRAQAFAFSTNDEINNMTFYSYEIINRSTYELRETYFSQWVDADLGFAQDDYVGCDVKRGLGYCYNGDENDGPGSGSYSGIPPAVGIDFFQGPYMDADGIDNPKIDIEKIKNGTDVHLQALLANYLQPDGTYDTISLSDDADKFYPGGWYCRPGDVVGNCAINGVNFGNGIIDDERFGMRRFIYYNNSDATEAKRDPAKATDYYNYLRGYWKDGKRMKFGGDGYNTGTTELDCDFMFPGDSDPLHWGTNTEVPSINPNDWTEVTSGSNVTPGDRRFMQSAGPFTLKPGAVNYITVGIPFAQATSGNAWSSVELLRQIDDVCQALFDNCFKVLDGPDAPTMYVQELNNEVVLYLQYDNADNSGENYSEIDASIPSYFLDEYGHQHDYSDDERSYKFEGYQIYQLVDANASVADIGNVSKARLVAQCDIENYYDTVITTYDTNGVATVTRNENPSLPIGTLVNYSTNTATNLITGEVKVEGANAGIKHVFRITTDMFATGINTKLVNNKEYYYICIAYAQNRYRAYSQTDPNYLDGQKEPYLAGRKTEHGGTIEAVTAIPHDPFIENGGTVAQAEFGMSPFITRYDGHGNGGNILKLDQSCIESIMGAPGQPAMAPGTFNGSVMTNPCIIETPRYEENYGPVNVKVIDPLNVKQGKYIISFTGSSSNSKWTISTVDGSPLWEEINGTDTTRVYTTQSDFAIGRYNEQLFLKLGIAVSIVNPKGAASDFEWSTGNDYLFSGSCLQPGTLLSSTMEFGDNTQQWLSGIPDNDNSPIYNWIRSGSQFALESYASFFQKDSVAPTYTDPYLDEDYFKAYRKSGSYDNPTTTALDKSQNYENVVYGLWAPYGLVSTQSMHPGFNLSYYATSKKDFDSLKAGKNYLRTYYGLQRKLMLNNYNNSLQFNDMSKLPSVRIVFTADTSKWTRCPVLEMCDDFTQSEGNARRFQVRAHKSVDKMGNTVDDLGIAADKNDPNNPAYIDEYGMGWFPGYAISIATGERLNIMFGEDSRYPQYNGRDMKWNPVSTIADGTANFVMGGRHFIYVMNATTMKFYDLASNSMQTKNYTTPSYDGGRWARQILTSLDRLLKTRNDQYRLFDGTYLGEIDKPCVGVRDSVSMLFASCAWVNMPLVSSRFEINDPMTDIPCDATINIHVNMPYAASLSKNNTAGSAPNGGKPQYMFEMTSDIVTLTNQALSNKSEKSLRDSLLSMISVVPNPYYSYSQYETQSQLETKVRFINVPEGSTISIYTVDGTLVRQFRKVTPTSTTYDWDLHNHNGIPIAGGMYLIHFNVPIVDPANPSKEPEYASRIVKWFGTMRPVDLNSYQY